MCSLGLARPFARRGQYDDWTPLVQNDALAGALAGLFDCRDRQRDVEDLVGGGPFDPEEVVESLDAVLDLPELSEPIPGEPRDLVLSAKRHRSNR